MCVRARVCRPGYTKDHEKWYKLPPCLARRSLTVQPYYLKGQVVCMHLKDL